MNSRETVLAVEHAIAAAQLYRSKLPPETLPLAGYSGRKGRHLLNNLAALFTPYVEVGCYRGSTLISAAYDNKGLIVGVDNFTDETKPGQFMVGTRQVLLDNLRAYSAWARPSLIDAPCWDVPLSGFACGFFDGGHTEEDHLNAVTRLHTWFQPCFVFVVDDFNRQNVRDGTLRGIKEASLVTEFYRHLGAEIGDDADGWWSGMGVFVLSR